MAIAADWDSEPVAPRAKNSGHPAKARTIVLGPALDEQNKPIRLRCYTRCCGTGLFSGLHDFDGAIWTTRLYETAAEDADPIRKCPGCGSLLFHKNEAEPHGREWPHVFSLSEIDEVCDRERDRLCAGGAFDERTLAALNCEIGEGKTFDEAAPLYGRTADQLSRELKAWLGAGNNQIQQDV